MKKVKTKIKSFARWYEANKVTLAATRKAKYDSDPVYRAKIIAASQAARMAKRGVVVPEGYIHHMTDAAEVLDITIWTLREWRKKNYFPEPKFYNGRLWFTGNQLQQLQALKGFFARRGRRMSEAAKPALEDLVSLIYANWEN